MYLRSAILTGLLLVWSFALYIGVGLYRGVLEQGIAGYPNSQQLIHFIILPAGMFLLTIGSIIARLDGARLFTVISVEIIAILWLLLVYGGGI